MRMHLSLSSLALMVATTADAAPVTFDLSTLVSGQSSYSITQDGVTLSFSNPTGSDNDHQEGTFIRGSGGLCVLGTNAYADFCGQSSFDMTFDTSVMLLSYTVGYYDQNGTMVPSLSYAPTQTAGWTDTLSDVGQYDFTRQAVLGAGEVVSVTNTSVTAIAPDRATVMFSAITVDTDVPPVPLPGAVWGMIAGIGALGVAARRRKTA